MPINASAKYLLVFHLPSQLRDRLIEATGDCIRSYNVYPSPGSLGYHVTVMPPFSLCAENRSALVRRLSSLNASGLRAVRLPTEFGEFTEPKRVLYIGGQEPNIVAAFARLQAVCASLAEENDILPRSIIPHCTLARGLPEEHQSLCRGLFEEVMFPPSLLLRSLVLYRKSELGWEMDWELSLVV